MSDSPKNLAELVTSRMCHDLINPVSAINTGLELLTMTGGTGGMTEEIALIQSSAESTTARIQFFRVAFGMPSEDRPIDGAELGRLAQQNIADARTDLIWRVEGDQDNHEAKLAMLLLMCARSAAPRGGLLKISRDRKGWQIDLSAEKITSEDSLWSRLSGNGCAPELMPASVQFELAYQFVEQSGALLTIQKRSKSLSVNFPPKTAWTVPT